MLQTASTKPSGRRLGVLLEGLQIRGRTARRSSAQLRSRDGYETRFDCSPAWAPPHRGHDTAAELSSRGTLLIRMQRPRCFDAKLHCITSLIKTNMGAMLNGAHFDEIHATRCREAKHAALAVLAVSRGHHDCYRLVQHDLRAARQSSVCLATVRALM